jgi:hypothetical protein
MALIFAASSIPNLARCLVESPTNPDIRSATRCSPAFLLRAFAGGRVRGITWTRGLLAILLATVTARPTSFISCSCPVAAPIDTTCVADFIGATLGVAVGGLASAARRWGILDSSS